MATPKQIEANRLNALRHGMRARTVVLELFYLEQMAVSQGKLTRMEVGEAGVYHEVEGARTQIPLLDRLWQAQCRMERSFARAQRELERIQSSRSFQAQQPQPDLAAAEPTEAPAVKHQPPAHVAHFPNAANFPPKPPSLVKHQPPSFPSAAVAELTR